MICLQRDLFSKSESSIRIKYADYMASEAWKKKRNQRVLYDKGKCQFLIDGRKCGDMNLLEVHHLTYANLGDELMSDLVTLCSFHHKQIHGINR